MVKKALLLLAAASFVSVSYAQRCYTDEMNAQLKKAYPQISQAEADFKAELAARLGSMDLSKFKTTAPGDTAFSDQETLYVPLVFHIVHDYGVEYVNDNDIYKAVDDINALYNGTHPLVSQVIQPFKGNIPGTNIKYIAKTNIKFVLPTKDPKGQPTHGITREHSYLSYFGDNQAKLNIWPPDSYINIWIVRVFGGNVNANVAAFALQPPAASGVPWLDGVIGKIQNGDINADVTLGHELGHSLGLHHPWNQSQSDPGLICGDDDVDDTPPTRGHDNCSQAALYDTTCAVGYMKVYSPAQAYKLFGIIDTSAVTINYPDTTNTQNVMDYAHCSRMLTYLQGVRMRAALRSPVAGRNNLPSAANLAITGALAPRQDLAPIADFSVAKNLNSSGGGPTVFVCAGKPVTFYNRSWNDTVSSVAWSFSNGGTSSVTNPNQQATTTFTSPGWVTASLTATSNAGSNTFTNPRAVYVADENAISTDGYFQEFDNGEPANYPMFNYFNNNSKWEVVHNAGFYDNYSIRYKNYDTRTLSSAFVNTPVGDYDDFFTPAFDFSSAPSDMKMNFFTSGAFRTNQSAQMKDTLEIRYSTNCGSNWTLLANVTGQDIGNEAVQLQDYTPAGIWNWKGQSLALPSAVVGNNQVFFRFRYKTFAGNEGQYGMSNNFYLDRIYFSPFTTDVSDLENRKAGIVLAPNPTTGSSTIMIKDVSSSSAQIQVTDITGKVVYNTEATLGGNLTKVEIPANVISVKGMYLVSVITGNAKHTEKLIVY